MARTAREKAATAAIEAAIQEYNLAFKEAHPEAELGTIVDWIIVAAEGVADSEDPDEDRTLYSIIMPGGGIPYYRARGLLVAGESLITHGTPVAD